MSANILLIYNYRAEQLTFTAFTVEKHVFDFLFTKERKLKRGQMTDSCGCSLTFKIEIEICSHLCFF